MKSAKYAYAIAAMPIAGRCQPMVRRPASSTVTIAVTPKAKSNAFGLLTR